MNETAEPGSLDWELECDRQDYNMATRLFREKQDETARAFDQLLRMAETYGRTTARREAAQEAGRDTSKLDHHE